MRIERTNIELNDSRFDAVLDTGGVDEHTNAQLTITLKVFLRANAGAPRTRTRTIASHGMHSRTETTEYGERPVSDLDGNQFMFANFEPTRWRNFTTFYQTEGQRFWDGNFWLTSPDSYINLDLRPEGFGHTSTLHPQPVIHPAVDCNFILQLVNNTAHAHKTIDVYNIVRNVSGGRFRADDAHYDQTAIDSAQHYGEIGYNELMCTGGQTNQRTFLHEIGHALGLDHVGVNFRIEGCFDTEDHNITICYGSTFRTRDNIMGAGETMSWAEALPWRRAMEVLTGTSRHSWEVHQSFVGPHEVLRTG